MALFAVALVATTAIGSESVGGSVGMGMGIVGFLVSDHAVRTRARWMRGVGWINGRSGLVGCPGDIGCWVVCGPRGGGWRERRAVWDKGACVGSGGVEDGVGDVERRRGRGLGRPFPGQGEQLVHGMCGWDWNAMMEMG